MKQVEAREIRNHPFIPDDDYTDDEFARCLCGDVTKDKRIDVQVRYWSEAQRRWRYKNVLTSHQDCPLHGTAPEPRNATRNEPADLQQDRANRHDS